MSIQKKDEASVIAVILAANTDFGRCKLASRIPPALWPIEDKPAIIKVLEALAKLPVEKTIICCNGNKTLLAETIENRNFTNLIYLDEKMPFGSAGCIREAAKISDGKLLVVVPAQLVDMPDITQAINAHLQNKSTLTIIRGNNSQTNIYTHIYVADREVADFMPRRGFFDIKENLIPALILHNKKIQIETLEKPLYSFRNHQQYLQAMSDYINNNTDRINKDAVSSRLQISPSAKILGTVILQDNCSIDDNVIIIGPAFIGNDVHIHENSVIEQSIIWNGTSIGKNCFVSSSVTEYNSAIFPYSNIVDNTVTRKDSLLDKIYYLRFPIGKIVAGIVLTAVFIWSYFSEIKGLIRIWLENDDYSAGILVPILLLAILWQRRKKMVHLVSRGIITGLIFFAASQMLRFFGLYFMYSSAERLSMIVCIWAMIITLFGWKLFFKNPAPFLFLLLMLPPPHIIHNSIMLPLQNTATAGAAFCLELFGYAVDREGNILYIDNNAIAVSEACNGLRMITAFFIIAVFISLISRKSLLERVSLLLSSLPVAFICNIVRLTFTAMAFTIFWGQKWTSLVHAFTGYAMVPMALILILMQMRIMNMLTKSQKNKFN